MNRDTPGFRVALTIAVIWIVLFAYLSYAGFRAQYRSVELALYSVPEDLTAPCFAPVPQWSGDDLRFRAPTGEETQSCLGQARESHARSIARGNQFALERGWKAFAWRGIVPALILLGLAAFWTVIVSGLTRAGLGYLNWLRFGSGKRPGQDGDEQASPAASVIPPSQE